MTLLGVWNQEAIRVKLWLEIRNLIRRKVGASQYPYFKPLFFSTVRFLPCNDWLNYAFCDIIRLQLTNASRNFDRIMLLL